MDIQEFVCFLKKRYFINKNIEKFIIYNISGGKFLRSLLFVKVLDVYNNKNKEFSADIYKSATRFSYTLELLQAYFLITDDIIDNSTHRRKKICWYKLEKKGIEALKECSVLNSLVYKILMDESKNKDIKYSYLLIKFFNECILKTWIGQLQDSKNHNIESKSDLIKFYNFKYYSEIVEYKTCAYTVSLPVKLGVLYYFGNKNKNLFETDALNNIINSKVLNQIFSDIAYFMQYQDDYLNFYPELSGKSGTDLEERKITFFTCLIVARFTENHELVKFLNYVTKKDNKMYINEIKKRILEIIENEYDSTENELHSIIVKKASDLNEELQTIIYWLLKHVFKRKV